MKIDFKRTPEQIELVRAMGSRDKAKSMEAMQAFARFITPVVQTVLNQASTSASIYTDLPYDPDDSPSIPLDLYLGKIDNYVTVWSQNMAGGLPTSQVTGIEELKVGEYNLTSAVNWLNKYARKARLDVIAAATNRLVQEIVVKQERNAWAVIMEAVAQASTGSPTGALSHVIAATTADQLVLHDFNKLLTRSRRIYQSFAQGTPTETHGPTDMYLSPELMQEIRGFAYQPMNSRGVPNSDESTALGLPDNVREEIFRNSGTAEIYGIGLHEILELGDGQKYNTLFKAYYTGTFVAASDQVSVLVDQSRSNAILRPVATDENGGQIAVQNDNQFLDRQDRSGLWATLSESRVVIDSRVLTAITV